MRGAAVNRCRVTFGLKTREKERRPRKHKATFVNTVKVSHHQHDTPLTPTMSGRKSIWQSDSFFSLRVKKTINLLKFMKYGPKMTLLVTGVPLCCIMQQSQKCVCVCIHAQQSSWKLTRKRVELQNKRQTAINMISCLQISHTTQFV